MYYEEEIQKNTKFVYSNNMNLTLQGPVLKNMHHVL